MPTSNSKLTELKKEEIAARAYQIWEASGRIPGSEVENWLQAERELASAKVAKMSSTPAKPGDKSAPSSAERPETGNKPKSGQIPPSKSGGKQQLVSA